MSPAILAASVIAVVRVALFWGGVTLCAEYPDWRQIAGYAVLMFDSIAEIGIASALADSRPAAGLLAAGLIVLTSGLLGWLWARGRFRLSLR